MLPELLEKFRAKKDLYIDSSTKLAGRGQKPIFSCHVRILIPFLFSGYLLLETVSESMTIYGEKMYNLKPCNNPVAITHLKGISKAVTTIIANRKPTDGDLFFDDEQAVVQTGLKRNVHGHITVVNNIKLFKSAVLPTKRFFIKQHSFPYFFTKQEM